VVCRHGMDVFEKGSFSEKEVNGMAWYWWALIVVGLVVIVWLKAIFVPKYFQKQREKRAARERMEGEDE